MKIKYLLIALLGVLLFSCDDHTNTIGGDLMPDSDKPSVGYQTFDVTTQSLLVDSVYARTSIGYLGKYTDPDFGLFEADFLTQFNCLENYTLAFPRKQIVGLEETGQAKNLSVNLYLYYKKDAYFGDSIAPCRLSIFELSEILTENKDSYYTNINPADYIGSSPKLLGQRAYTAVDLSVSDSARNNTKYIPKIVVRFTSNELGNNILKWSKDHPEWFANSDAFIKNVFKGVYVKCDHGDGTILYIDQIALEVKAECYVDSAGVFPLKRKQAGHVGEDSTALASVATFSATKEVIQSNHFQNKGKIKELVNEQKWTYVKSPAGIFTEATLPVEEIGQKLSKDTLNSVKLVFTGYNDNGSSIYKMGAPEHLLMVRKKEMYTFFEKNKLADGITSYLVSYDPANKEYSFSNVSRLISACIKDKPQPGKEDNDWNKVVLIPVTVSKDSKSNIISVNNDLQINSIRLKGGLKEGNQLKMGILYTTISPD